jgi:dipeptidyl aminopeptidase/acylaminoacyl peptidase
VTRVWISLAVVALACLGAGTASASFPGRNGEIVYGWVGDSAYRAGPTATSIRAVDPRSGRVRVLQDCPLHPAPTPYTDCMVSAPRSSPDGRTIALAITEIDPPGGTGDPQHPGLATMTSDGGGLEVHVTGDRYFALAWSPSGRQLLLQHEPAEGGPAVSTAVFLASLDGTELGQAAPVWSAAPDWSSTGRIAYVRSRVTDPSCRRRCEDIFITRLGGTPRRLTYRGGSSPSWSPHGTKLVFVRTLGTGHGDLYIVRRDGRGLRRLTRRGGYAPAWSPDGKWIAFNRYGDLYVVRATGRGLRRLVNAPIEPTDLEGPSVTAVDWQALPAR